MKSANVIILSFLIVILYFPSFQSADEKLRSLGGKHHNSKSGSHAGQTKSSTLPLSQPQHHEQKLIYYPPHEGEIVPTNFTEQQLSTEDQEFNANMAERKIHLGRRERFRKESSQDQVLNEDGKIVIKRRSRSAGAQGRAQMPKGGTEPESGIKGQVQAQTNRHSMYSDLLSDDGDCAADKENSLTDSDSADSGPKKWTKNPLHVKRARKSDRTEKRKSAHNLENGFNLEPQKGNADADLRPSRASRPSNREAYVYQEKDLQAAGQKGKYQRLEEMRRKRVDMAVTSDEEFTPASRISQLRQRAIQSVNMSNKNDLPEDLADFHEFEESPNLNRISGTRFQPSQSPAQSTRKIIQRPASLQKETQNNRLSFGIDYNKAEKPEIAAKPSLSAVQYSNSRIKQPTSSNASFTHQIGAKTRNEQTNGYLNASDGMKYNKDKIHSQIPTWSETTSTNVQDKGLRFRELPQGGRVMYSDQKQFSANIPRNDFHYMAHDGASDNEMTSFQEIQADKPVHVKKAIEKLETTHKSVSHSEDSLDELLESNIQYLENEMVNRKGKKSNNPQSFPLRDIPTAPEKGAVRGKKASSLENVAGSANTNLERKHSLYQNYPASAGSSETHLNRPIEKPEIVKPKFSAYQRVPPSTPQKVEHPRPPVTYSPFLYRRSADLSGMEDMSKSDTQINTATNYDYYNQGQVIPSNTYRTKISSVPLQQDYTNSYQTHNFGVPCQQDRTSSYPTQSVSAPLVQEQTTVPNMKAGDAGMFSDVDYDIEVSDRVRKWETFMKKASDNQGLTTIEENDGKGRAAWERDIPCVSVPVTKITTHLPKAQISKPQVQNFMEQQTRVQKPYVPEALVSKPQVQTFVEPRVMAHDTGSHRVFKVVQDPKPVLENTGYKPVHFPPSQQQHQMPPINVEKTIKPYESPRLSRQKLVWKPPSASTQAVNDKQNVVRKPPSTIAVSDSDLALNAGKQNWPPYESDSGVLKGPRLSKYEDEIVELKELTSERFQNLKKRFDSDSDIQQTQAQPSVPFAKPLPSAIIDRWESGSNTSASVSEPRTPSKLHSPTKGRDQKIDWSNMEETNTEQEKPKKKFWSPNMESRGQGLVSIERMTARTLQTIPFSEDPIWRELEELTSGNFDDIPKPAYIQNQLELENIINSLQQHATSYNVEQPTLNQIPPTPPLQSSVFLSNQTPISIQSNHSNSTLTATPQNIQSPHSSELSESLREFSTPKIRPLTLTIHSSSSAAKNALDDVLEDIRTSLEKKPTSPRSRKTSDSHLSSPGGSSLLAVSPGSQLHGPSSLTQVIENESIGPVTPRKGRQPQPVPTTPPQTAQPTSAPSSQGKYIDPIFTQFPYIINGNYQLDPDLLKERLLNTGLAEFSDREGAPRVESSHPANSRFMNPKQMNSTREQQGTTSVIPIRRQPKKLIQTKPKVDEDAEQPIEELEQLAKDVETKLAQIKSKIVTSDEDRLDSILLALRKFAPEIDPKIPEPKVTAYSSQDGNKKNKLHDALTELEKIYESLDLDSEVLMNRAERKECMPSRAYETVPAQTKKTIDFNQSSRFVSGSFPQTNNSHITHAPSAPISRSGGAQKGKPLSEMNKNNSSIGNFNSNQRNIDQQSRMIVEGVSHNPNWNRSGSQERANKPYRDPNDKGDNKSKKSSSFIVLTPPMTPGSYQAFIGSNMNKQTVKKPPANIGSQTSEVNSGPVSYSQTQTNISEMAGLTQNIPQVRMRTKQDNMDNSAKRDVATNSLNNQSDSKRKATLAEHRRSVPADFSEGLKRTVETQTSEPSPTVAEVRGKFESDDKSVLSRDISISSESSVDVKIPRKRKISRGIANLMGIFSSSDDERSTKSGLKHSHSAPDLSSMFSSERETDVKITENKKSSKHTKKIKTPRSVKQRHEARARHKSLQYYHVSSKESSEQDDITSFTSPTSDDSATQSPQTSCTKPPLYPLKKGTESSSYKKSISDETPKLSSDEMDNRVNLVLRRTDNPEKQERPKSFHELLSTFESHPERIEKLQKRLRKCASVDLTETDMVLSKMYHSEPDIRHEPRSRRASDSEAKVMLKLELQWKS